MQQAHTTFRTMLCTVLGGLAVAGGAWANQGWDGKFKQMDGNGDGKVSAVEHAAHVTAQFGRMDANGDGSVTAAEMDAGMGMQKGMRHEGMHQGMHDKDMKPGAMRGMAMSATDRIATMDTDGNGSLSSAEHDAGARKMFQEMDGDGDGHLSQQEFQAGHRTKVRQGDDAPAGDPPDGT